MKPLSLAAFAVAALCHLPSAEACFDGFSVQGERLTASIPTDGDWRMSQARTMARWTNRFDALLPVGTTLHLESYWSIALCQGPDSCEEIEPFGEHHEPPSGRAWTLETRMARVFERTADALGRDARQRARARRAKTMIYSVQVGSFRSPDLAGALVDRLNDDIVAPLGELAWRDQGFYGAGGHPWIQRRTRQHPTDVDGTTFHRVIAGVFLDATRARAHQARLADAGFASSLNVEGL
jgi:hypothetical protein